MGSEVRVRFAPSPTGYLHIGGARTCLFNWLFARNHGGKLILRIEDTDQDRLKEGSIEQIIDSLQWLGLDWDEGPTKGGSYGPYFQSERIDLYLKEAERLVHEGKAYYCYCTAEDLELRRKEANREKRAFKYDGRCIKLSEQEKKLFESRGIRPAIRLKVSDKGTTVVNDMIRGKVSFENSLMDDFIIVKSNGTAAYNFACVIDDNGMNISHVIRAEEHLSNTPKQILMYDALGYKLPEFVHVPMILAPDRSKLSKRHGATSVEEFREQGYIPEAIVNYLCLLGWSEDTQSDIFPIQNAIKQFSIDRVSKNAAIYDTKKLTWINGHYLRSLDLNRISELVLPFLINKGIVTPDILTDELKDRIKQVVALVREKVWTLLEVAEGMGYFFTNNFEYDQKGVEKYFSVDGALDTLEKVLQLIKTAESFDKDELEKLYRAYAESQGIKVGQLIHPTRLALTGRTVTPGLFEVMELIGREECISRIQKAIDYIQVHNN